MKGHLTREAQIQAAIEYAAMAYEYLLRPREEQPRSRRRTHVARIDDSKAKPQDGSWTAATLAEFVRHLQGTENRELGSAERILRKYTRYLTDVVPNIEVNFQGGYISDYTLPASQVRLCSHYFRTFVAENLENGIPAYQNDTALQMYVYAVGTLQTRHGRPDYTKAIHQLVVISYAIQYRLKLRIVVLGASDSKNFLEITPVALFCNGSHVSLVIRDAKDYKIVELNKVAGIESDLQRAFISREEKEPVNMDRVRALIASMSDRFVCEVPRSKLSQCLSSIADLTTLDFQDSETARITIQGSSEAVDSALLAVLPYVKSITPGTRLDQARARVLELNRAVERIS
ncbi:MAG: hypothetical protein JNM27_08690 [Leptospirales bacterium]|nr:hypothetical protein [Leptospirales bacterium]